MKGIFIPLYKEEFQLSDTQVGAITTAAMLALAIFQYLSSLIIGKTGYKKFLILGFLVVGGALVLVAFSDHYLTLLLSIFFALHRHVHAEFEYQPFGAGLGGDFSGDFNELHSRLLWPGKFRHAKDRRFPFGKRHSMAFLLLISIDSLRIDAGLGYFVKIPYQPKVVKAPVEKSPFKNPMIYLYMLIAGFYSASEAGIGAGSSTI